MSRITPITGIAFGVLIALIALFVFAMNSKAEAGSNDLRVGLACTPTTNAQSYAGEIVESGDPQLCRVKAQNRGKITRDSNNNPVYPSPILGVTYTHPTPNNGVSLSATHRNAYGSVIAVVPCNQQTFTCDPVDLAYGESLLVVENLQFDIGQDGRSRTRAYASGVQDGVVISGTGTEQKTLP